MAPRLLLVLSLLALPALAQEPPTEVPATSERSAPASGSARIESEHKLSVPDALLEPLRGFLVRRYGAGEGSILPELGGDFSAIFSDEAFVDRYFDTPALDLLRAEGGVRHRTRRNLGDASRDRKHGRQLVQLKLSRPGDDVLNRSEVKFDVDPPRRAKGDLDRHPLIGLVDRDQQQALIGVIAAAGFDARRMQETLVIEQRRWRVYLSRGGAPFATLTLDEVQSSWVLSKIDFVELEIELNEILYTEASRAEREAMEAVSRRLAADIMSTFPAVKQDQTPKYNKVYDALSKELPRLDLLLIHGKTFATGLLVLTPLALSLAWSVRSSLRRRLAARARRAGA